MRKYAQPIPDRADEEFDTAAWSERRLSSNCRAVTPTYTGSDDDDDNAWRNTPRPTTTTTNEGNTNRPYKPDARPMGVDREPEHWP